MQFVYGSQTMTVLSEEILHSATSYTQIGISKVSVRLGLAVESQNTPKNCK